MRSTARGLWCCARASRCESACGHQKHWDSALTLDEAWIGLKRAMSSAAADGERSRAGRQAVTGKTDKIVAAVVLERLPVVLPDLPKPVAEFKSYSFAWRQQYRRHYPDAFLNASSSKEDDGGNVPFEPAPRITEADARDNRRSLLRGLDHRLYLILHGFPFGSPRDKPVWHFPEKQYTQEETLRVCAESALTSFVDNPANDLYFVGNAPIGHIQKHCLQPGAPVPVFKRFFFKSQFIGSKVNLGQGKHKDYAWVSKKELLDYLEEPDKDFMKKLLAD